MRSKAPAAHRRLSVELVITMLIPALAILAGIGLIVLAGEAGFTQLSAADPPATVDTR